jgi:hypothetical protein
MKGSKRLVVAGIMVAMTIVFLGIPAFAQDKPADDMQIVREKIKADKKLFVSENMGLTDSEAKAFWPVYDAYQKDLAKRNERAGKLIDDYAKNYDSMSNEAAKKLIDDWMAIQADQQKMRASYLPKFRAILSEKKVARYYQLENKINAVVSYALAANIPLVK